MSKHVLTPNAYAREHVPAPLLSQPSRIVLRRELPRMLAVPWRDKPGLERGFSGVPLEAIVGFTTVASSEHEDTARSRMPDGSFANEHFHEGGLFQTPMGAADGPAPNPDKAQPNNAWGAHSDDDYTREMLGGRDAVMGPDEWMLSIPDQTAIGLADLRGNMLAVSRKLGAAGVKDPSSTWALALAFMGFSTGATTAARRIEPWISELARVPEARRFSAWADLMERDRREGKHVYLGTLLNPWSKLESGRLVAEKLGTADRYARWYDAPRVDPGPWVDQINASLAEQANTDRVVAVVVGLTFAGILGYYGLKKRKRTRR